MSDSFFNLIPVFYLVSFNKLITVETEIDLFSKDGYFLYETKLSAHTHVIKNGSLYAYVMDQEAGIEYVKRYKIKNWEQIKTGI